MRKQLEDFVTDQDIIWIAHSLANQIKQVEREEFLFWNAFVKSGSDGVEDAIGVFGVFFGDGGKIDDYWSRIERELF